MAVNFAKLRLPCRHAYQLPCISGSMGAFKCHPPRSLRIQILGKLSPALLVGPRTMAHNLSCLPWYPYPLGVNCCPSGHFWQTSRPSWAVWLITGWLIASCKVVFTWSQKNAFSASPSCFHVLPNKPALRSICPRCLQTATKTDLLWRGDTTINDGWAGGRRKQYEFCCCCFCFQKPNLTLVALYSLAASGKTATFLR